MITNIAFVVSEKTLEQKQGNKTKLRGKNEIKKMKNENKNRNTKS